MTAQEYRAAGFTELSGLIAQETIDRAEKDVFQAYIQPIAGEVDLAVNEVAKDALMNLAVLCILQRSIFATRSGAKEKTTPQSQTAQRWDIQSQAAATCAMKLRELAKSVGIGNTESCVTDICGIFFNTQYFHI